MYLHDILRICLLALESRYPEHSMDIDAQICELQGLPEQEWTAFQVFELLDDLAPELLAEPATLVINEQCCAIFLPGRAKDRPAIRIHCHGKLPIKRYSIAQAHKTSAAHLNIDSSTSIR